ncbi:MAG: hypothetical protein RBR22_13060 [Desulfuromonas sp.]|nr:hypothetical protein [Desulfuromonas sp.]
MKSIIKAIVLLVIFPLSTLAFEFDMTNPITVAKNSTEWGLKFQYDKVRMISCKEISNYLTAAEKQADQAIELFRRNGIDFRKEVAYDFSNLSYELVSENESSATVHLKGNYKATIPNAMNKNNSMNRQISLKKKDGFYYFCGGEKLSNN